MWKKLFHINHEGFRVTFFTRKILQFWVFGKDVGILVRVQVEHFTSGDHDENMGWNWAFHTDTDFKSTSLGAPDIMLSWKMLLADLAELKKKEVLHHAVLTMFLGYAQIVSRKLTDHLRPDILD